MFVYNICFEVASAALLIILYIYMRLQYSHQSQANIEFERLTLYMLTANVSDVVSAITLTYASMLPRWVNMITNTIYFVASIFLGYQFAVYSKSCVTRRKKELFPGEDQKKDFMSMFNKFLVVVFFGIFFINFFHEIIFSIGENGEYLHGALYYSVYILSYYFISYSGFVLIKNHKLFEKKQMVSVVIYLVIAFSGPVLQMLFFQDVLLTIFSSALGLVMMLFSMETPDYQKLVKTMEQLEYAQRKAEDASQAKSRFLANMSHEVRTPVNAILGYNEMIMKKNKDSLIEEYALNVQAAGRTLTAMFHDILDFTNMDSDSFSLCKEPYETRSLIQDVVTYAFFATESKQLQLQLDIDEKIPKSLYGDVSRLMQILNNLTSNAVKYTQEGFVGIHIGWEQRSGYEGALFAEITDSGIGIRKEDIPKVIGYFSHMDTNRDANTEGIGLGISIVTKLLELMGSRLEIESVYGKGSKFSFEISQRIVDNTPIGCIDFEKHAVRLPVDSSQESEKNHSLLSDLPDETSAKKQLLIVDSNAMNLRIAKKILEKTYEVHVAKSAKETFGFLEKHLPDLVLMDIHIPDMNGFEILKKMQDDEKSIDIPVIMMISDEDMGVEAKVFETGALDFIKKPFVEEVVLHRVLRILELTHLKKKWKSK